MNVLFAALAVLGGIVIVVLALAVVFSLPGLMRYMRIRRM